jgi:hypothetical protein
VSRRAAAGLLACAALLAATGCGGSDDEADEPAPRPRPVETAEKPPKLPQGWDEYVNRAGGFALGLPPGWKAKRRGVSTQIQSYDRLVVMAITPDRTSEAIELEPDESATRTVVALPGFADELEPGDPRPFKHRYQGAEVRAAARTADRGVEERVRVIVLRRPRLAVFTVVIAANAERRSRPAERLALRAIGTLRSQPVGGPGR